MQHIKKTHLSLDVGHRIPYELEVTEQDVVLRGLPKELHGATFAHISDLHGGFAGLEPVYEEAISQVNRVDPDFIFFTGDYIDKRATPYQYPMQDILARFHARRGMYGCLGNHDHRRGAAGVRRMLESVGIQPLVNEGIQLDSGLWLAGVDDLYEGEPDIAKTLADLPKEQTSIVLSHNPRLIEKAKGRELLILSGHTHGAQFRLKFPTPLMICYMHLRCWQVAGWYRRKNTRLYVNRGLGVTGKPKRINCPAEIAFFRMLARETDGEQSFERSDEPAVPRAAAAHGVIAGRR